MWSGYWGHWGYAGPAMGLVMFLFWIAIVVVIGAIAWAVIRGSARGTGPRSHAHSALRILEERYARGEIGKEEFDQKRRDLLQ